MIVRMNDDLAACMKQVVELAMVGAHWKHDSGMKWPLSGDDHQEPFQFCQHPDCCLYRDILLPYKGIEEIDPDWI